jgi:hypothetical protein
MLVVHDFKFGRVPDFFHGSKLVFKLWKKGVAPLDVAFHECQVKVRAARQGVLVYLRAAAHKNVVGEFPGIQPVERIGNENLSLDLFAQFRKMKLVGALEEVAAGFATAPFLELTKDFRVLLDELAGMAREHEVFAAGQGVADAFKRLSPHHDDVAHGHFLEPLKIVRQIPRDFPLRPNHAVLRHRSDGFEVFQDNVRRTA